MCPTADQGDSFHLLELFVSCVAVTLHDTTVAPQQFNGYLARTAAPVIMEHDVSRDAVTHAPLITLLRLMFLIVHHGDDTLINLYILTGKYLLFEQAVQRPESLYRHFIPSAHGRFAYADSRFAILLYQTVEREMVHELADDDVRQYRSTCHAFADRNRRKRMNQYLPFLRVFLHIGFSYHFVTDGLQDIDFCRNTFQTGTLFLSDFNEIILKPAFRVSCPFGVEINNFYRKRRCIQGLADRLFLYFYCLGDFFLTLADFSLHPGYFHGGHFFL